MGRIGAVRETLNVLGFNERLSYLVVFFIFLNQG